VTRLSFERELLEKKMKKSLRCTDCGAILEAKEVSQEFVREGVRVCISGIPALVCPNCGDVSFAPGVAQKVVEAANSLFEVALQKRLGKLVVSVSKASAKLIGSGKK